jgi:penicillin amidase
MELHYNGKSVIGASHPGVPLIAIGRTNNIAWGLTSALTDLSDLFKEKLSEDGS